MPDQPPAVETPAAPAVAVIPPRSEDAPATETPEQLADQAREKMAKMDGFWNRVNPPKEGVKEKEPTPDPAPPAPEPEKKPKDKAKAKDTPAPTPEEKPKGKRRKEQPEVDPIAIAEATGREIAREMARDRTPSAPEPEVELELPEEFERDVQVFDEMAKLKPKEYGDIRKKLAKYAKAEDDYRTKWEADHVGEEFDPDSDEHNEFYQRIKPDYDQRDFDLAKESLIEQRAAAKAEERVRQEIRREFEQRERAGQVRLEIEREMIGLMGEMLKEADPDNAELAKDWASIQTLDEKNPLLADVMVHVHNETKPVLEATVRLFRGIDKADDQNPVHQKVFSLISEIEQQVSRLPIKDRYHEDGRLFATQEQYSKMSASERQRHWYVDEYAVSHFVKGQAIGQTKKVYEAERQRIERYSKGQSRTEAPKPAKAEETAPKPVVASPSVSGRATLPGDGTPVVEKPTNGKGWFFNRYLGT